MKVVIVGEKDHGKSTLIGRLLYDTNSIPQQKLDDIRKTHRTHYDGTSELQFSFITDALEEERKQGLTIETTQTFFRSDKREFSIIDVPGHKEFLRNMVTGASQANAAILIVDSKEGIREQTKRHAYILEFLGIEQTIVAVNKMDLVGFSELRFNEIKNDLAEYLTQIGIKPECFLPISAYKGDNVVTRSHNMPWYSGNTVIQALDSLKEVAREYHFRMPIQDVYEIEEDKISVGTILSGSLTKGDNVEIFPPGGEAKIRGIVTFEGELEEATKPRSIGVIFDGGLLVERGNVICKGENPLVVTRTKASILCMSDELLAGGKYGFRCTTQETGCTLEKVIERIDTTTLEELAGGGNLRKTEIGKVILEFERPVVVERFSALPELGRFILEEQGEIVAGGVIT